MKTESTPIRDRRWPRARRALLVLVGLITVIALVYAEEDWRGQRSWQKRKLDLEAKGQAINWSAHTPSQVPDDQNFFKAPNMNKWFVGRGTTELSKNLSYLPRHPSTQTVAEITILSPGQATPCPPGSLVISSDDPTVTEKTGAFLDHLIGKKLQGESQDWWTIVVSLPPVPGQIFVKASSIDGPHVAALFQSGRVYYFPIGDKSTPTHDFKLVSAGTNIFRLIPNTVNTASEILAAWDNAPEFQQICAALKRPLARIDGDYSLPYDTPIPNFVTFRSVVKMLAERARCYLVLDRPADAIEQLSLLHALCRTLELPPSGKPRTLVSAMINVTLSKDYVDALAEGIKAHTWNEQQLTQLQDQLKKIDLLRVVAESVFFEQAATCAYVELTPPTRIARQFSKPAWDNLKDLPAYLAIRFAPRGWYFQNMISITEAMQPIIGIINVNQSQISPRATATAITAVEHTIAHWTPYSVAVSVAVPNFMRATITTAKNQTLINEAYIACALERYHLSHHDYPETLNALCPQFCEKIPHDIIGGQPLHYRRISNSEFTLYSVGWNERDDGGKFRADTTGDWVWGE